MNKLILIPIILGIIAALTYQGFNVDSYGHCNDSGRGRAKIRKCFAYSSYRLYLKGDYEFVFTRPIPYK